MKTLVIIDVQTVFDNAYKVKDLIQGAVKDYDLVLATRFIPGNNLYKQEFNWAIPEDKENEILIQNVTKTFDKTGYGLPKQLLDYLKESSVSSVDICGVDTDACVLAAMYSLWDNEIVPNLIVGLTATDNEELQQAAIRIVSRNFLTGI